MNITRPYQEGFYQLSRRVRDPNSRSFKAEKIRWVLQTNASQLNEAVCVDVGASSGLVASQLSSLFQHIVGVDYDQQGLLAAMPQTRQRVDLLRGDGMCLPFASASVDVVICAQVYEHVAEDTRLFNEIYRILRPGGLVFFSGPNWLFPIEPHYFLPFLHWLPPEWADRYLQLTQLGDSYYERSRSYWDLRNQLQAFIITDVTADVLQFLVEQKPHSLAQKLLQKLLQIIPANTWKMLSPFFPNFNWLLQKPA